MKKRLVIGFVILFFSFAIMPIVFALDTQIDVLSKPDRMITVRFIDINKGGTIERGAFIDQILDESNKASVVFSSDIYNYVKLSFIMRDSAGGLIKFSDGASSKTFNDVKTGWIYSVDLTPQEPILVQIGRVGGDVVEEPVAPKENSSLNEIPEEPVEEVVEKANVVETPSITGNAIVEGKKLNVKVVGYFLGLIFAIGLVMFVLFTMKKNKSENIKSAVKIKEKDDIIDEDLELQDAERRIKEAEEEIKDIKGKKYKLKEAEEKLRKDKEELERVRREAS